MPQLADRAGFEREPFSEARVACRLRRQHLDRDVAAERRLVGLVDRAHSAGADLPHDLVVAKSCARGEGHSAPSTRNASTGDLRPLSSSDPSAVARTPLPAAASTAAEQMTSPAFA